MTDGRIAAIKARLAAASPGPWEWCNDRKHGHEDDALCVVGDVKWLKLSHAGQHQTAEHREVVGSSEWMRVEQPDADFIAHARSDIPFLLARIEQLTKLIEAAK